MSGSNLAPRTNLVRRTSRQHVCHDQTKARAAQLKLAGFRDAEGLPIRRVAGGVGEPAASPTGVRGQAQVVGFEHEAKYAATLLIETKDLIRLGAGMTGMRPRRNVEEGAVSLMRTSL